MLDAGSIFKPSGVTTFQYELTGGSYTGHVVATAQPTPYGWLAQEANGTWGWDSTSVPSGTYTLTPVVTLTNGDVVQGAGTTVTVSNPAPTAQVLTPSGSQIYVTSSVVLILGPTTLVGEASYSQNVTQFTFDLNGAPIGTAIPFIYGWALPNWDPTTVAAGTYTLTAVATYADGATATSPGITVANFLNISIGNCCAFV
jgi:hypothetical protein